MNDKQFEDFTKQLEQYLAEEKVFVKNPARMQEFQHATEIANALFQDAQISIEDDPIQMGALILRIDCFDITVRGTSEINLFSELISKADNFEIYATGDERIHIAILFNNALIRVQ